MAHLYSNENFPAPVIAELRRFGHDALSSREAGNAGRAVPDEEVLAFAIAEGRVLLTINRRHFVCLHAAQPMHAGIIVCTFDPDFTGQAARLDRVLASVPDWRGQLVRVNRPQ